MLNAARGNAGGPAAFKDAQVQEVNNAVVVTLPDGSLMRFRKIEAGSFLQGSPADEVGRDPDESPQREVTISKSFYLGVTEVTQRQWIALGGNNPSAFQQPDPTGGDPLERPVESVSWQECLSYAKRLGERCSGKFRLPTEAEWEYACRAGTKTRFAYGEAPQRWMSYRHAWVNNNSEATTHPVAQKPANPWGIYDLHGSVWEWCSDYYGPYSATPAADPHGPINGTSRVFRGGSWFDLPPSCRSANRHRHAPNRRYTAIGLRLIYEAEEQP
ncbi:formylglycine-generating enzyme family protein [Botrimarina hoheduenensis]|uniref:formylglycine-generating enzyme family protein n=1 Tax=Botrimarina hoheduenensis TaxID=2528000 RepID=UPI0018D3B661|nr:formylglycine-generating enzyme family protein [Botrimarina hoheduenensis]